MREPLSDSLEGIDELGGDVAGQGTYRCDGLHHALGFSHELVKEIIDTGRIGSACFAVSNISQYFPAIRPDYRAIYFARRESGGGTLFDMCPIWSTSSNGSWAEKAVSCLAERLALSEIETDDTAALNIRYHGGALGQINTVIYGRNFRYDLAVHGTRARWNTTASPEPFRSTRRSARLSAGQVHNFATETDALYVEQAAHFLAATGARSWSPVRWKRVVRRCEPCSQPGARPPAAGPSPWSRLRQLSAVALQRQSSRGVMAD